MSETIDKGIRAQRLLDDPDLKQAFQDVRDALLKQFSNTSTTDADTMLEIRNRLHLLDSVEANLYRAIEDGHLEAFQIEEQKRPPFLGDLVKWRTRT